MTFGNAEARRRRVLMLESGISQKIRSSQELFNLSRRYIPLQHRPTLRVFEESRALDSVWVIRIERDRQIFRLDESFLKRHAVVNWVTHVHENVPGLPEPHSFGDQAGRPPCHDP